MRTADVSTTVPSTLLILDLVDFRTFTAHHPDLARLIDAEGKRRMTEESAAARAATPERHSAVLVEQRIDQETCGLAGPADQGRRPDRDRAAVDGEHALHRYQGSGRRRT